MSETTVPQEDVERIRPNTLEWLARKRIDAVNKEQFLEASIYHELELLIKACHRTAIGKPWFSRQDYDSDTEYLAAYNAALDELRKLQPGDLVTHCTGTGYVVLTNDGKSVIAVNSVTVTNPLEWKIAKMGLRNVDETREELLLEISPEAFGRNTLPLPNERRFFRLIEKKEMLATDPRIQDIALACGHHVGYRPSLPETQQYAYCLQCVNEYEAAGGRSGYGRKR